MQKKKRTSDTPFAPDTYWVIVLILDWFYVFGRILIFTIRAFFYVFCRKHFFFTITNSALFVLSVKQYEITVCKQKKKNLEKLDKGWPSNLLCFNACDFLIDMVVILQKLTLNGLWLRRYYSMIRCDVPLLRLNNINLADWITVYT